MENEKRRVLVTGASRGIGRSIAIKLGKQGFCITVTASKNSPELDSVGEELKELGAYGGILTFDVGNTEESHNVLTEHIERNGAFWGIVSNAGITRDGAFPALNSKDWFDVINIDLNGFFNVVHPCIMPMIGLRDGGRIIGMSSVSGMMGNRGQTNYSAAKAGLIGACKALAVELGKRKITVNCIAPGLIKTDMLQMNEIALKTALEMIPMRRMGEPEEVASLVSFLMGDDAAYITRQVISINGGML